MGIKAWYKFDNNNRDSIGNNITLTSTGTYVPGKTTTALDLDSGGSGIISPSVSGMDNNNNIWSISVWAKPDLASWISAPSRYSLLNVGSYYATDETDIYLSQHGGSSSSRTMYMGCYQNKVAKTVPDSHTFTDAELGDWILFVISCDDKKLYYDSYAVQSNVWRNTSSDKSWDNITYPFRDKIYIGGYGWDDNNWRAPINDCKLYDHKLSLKEIKELAKAKVAHYTFNDQQEPTVNEFSEAIMVNSTYGGPGVIQTGALDAFGTTENPVHRITEGKLRFGNSGGVDVGTLYYGKTYTFSIYLRKVNILLDTVWELDICDRGDSHNYSGSLESNIDTGWKRFSVTALHDNNAAYHFLDVGKYLGTDTWEWCCAQIEENDHATPFVPYGPRDAVVTDISGFKHDTHLAGPDDFEVSISSNVTIDENNVTKLGTAGSWDAGATSAQIFTDDCFIEWNVDYHGQTTLGAEMVGFTNAHSTWSYSDIDFCIYTHENNSVSVYESNSSKGQKATWDLSMGNVFRIEVVNNIVTYYLNGKLIYTSLTAAVFPLYADMSLHSHGAPNTIANIKMGYLASAKTSPEWTEDSELGNGSYKFNKSNEERIRLLSTNIYDKTISFWVKIPAGAHTSTDVPPFLAYNDGKIASSGDTNQILLCMQNDTFRMHGWGSLDPICTTNINDGEWHHLVWQMKYHATDAAQRLMNMWIDGNREVTNYPYSSGDFAPVTGKSWWTGYNSHSYSPYLRALTGNIDDIRMYATVLSDSDVQELYHTKAQLDKSGNLFVNEMVTNGVRADKNNLVNYEYIDQGTRTSSATWQSDISGRYIGYTSDVNHSLRNEAFTNPIGELDIMARHTCDTTHYVQYTRPNSYYYFNNYDITKTYRYSQWTYWHKEPGTSTSQNMYLGVQGSTICNLNTTTANTNPYFETSNFSNAKYTERWALQVFYIYPYGSTGNPSGGKIYYPDGTSTTTGTSFNWNTGYTASHIRQYHMYQYAENQAGSFVNIYRPRLEPIDGNELSIEELISCSEHRPIINKDQVQIPLKSTFGKNGIAFHDSVSEVGITNGLVGYWKLDGDAKDYSGNGYDGTVSLATITNGLKGSAYEFNGSTSVIYVPTIASIGTDSFTFNIWAYFDDATGARDVIYGNYNNSPILNIERATSGGIRLYWNAVSDLYSSAASIPVNEWCMITVCRDKVNNKVQMFVNSSNVYDSTLSLPDLVLTNVDFNIGRDYRTDTTAFNGKATNARIYNRALSAKEIHILYKYGLPDTGMQVAKDGNLYVNNEIIEGL